MDEKPEKPIVPNLAFDAYVHGLIHRDFESLTKEEIAQEIGVTRNTLYNWDKKIDWEWLLAERRKQYSRVTPSIDDAMIRKAQKGDVRAAEIYYQRFDNWIPTSALRSIDETIKDSEVEKKLKEFEERVRASIAGSVPIGASGVQPPDSTEGVQATA